MMARGGTSRTLQDSVQRSIQKARPANFAMKLSEKSRMHLRSSLTGHRTGTFSVHFGLHMAPNPRSERCSNHFSDSFVTEFHEVHGSKLPAADGELGDRT